MKTKSKNDEIDLRKRTLMYGITYPFDWELVMLILGAGTKNIPIETLSHQIVEVLDSWDKGNFIDKLLKIKGMGESKVLAIAAALELGKRRSSYVKVPVKKPADIIPFVRNYAMNDKELFIVITLNGGHEIIQTHVISIGTINRTLVHPREVFTVAVKENASAIMVCHNHPSGNCQPSSEDIETTQLLLDASEVMGIPILDHIIICANDYFSFIENKLIFES